MPVNKKSLLNLKPFIKNDPRINKAGVPPDARAGRQFIASVGAELIKTASENGKPSEEMTRFYALVRRMYSSPNPKAWELILKAALPGLLKEEIDFNNPDGSLKPEQMKPSEIAERVAALLKAKDAK